MNTALEGWVKLIGIDAEGNIPRDKDNPWGDWDLREHTEKLNESRTLDPTGLTTFMMLRGIVELYLRDVKFSAYSLILDPRSIGDQLRPMKTLRDVLEAPQVVQLIGDFQQKLRDAAVQYGVQLGAPTDALETLIGDRYNLAQIRKDALVSLDHLEAHQFTQGEHDGNPVKFVPKVYEFWNINSLLLAMRTQRISGISLCLIRDPEEALHSYFVFAIRNGSTMTILTDRDKDPHPAFKRMGRRPDRRLERRAARNWFPYHLLELERQEDELGNTKRVFTKARTQLVPVNVEAVALKDIRDLEPEEFIWTTLMFDLIRDKFWTQQFRLPELSYTGEMVVDPQALVGKAGALVRDGLYQPLELPALKKEDVTAETTKAQWGRESTSFNRWMVERYGDKVPEMVFNPVGAQAKLLLEAKAGELLPVLKDHWGTAITPVFETLSPIMFGTKDQIQRDRVWVARMNQMKAIQQLAVDEYNREKDSIIEWYRKAIEKNMEFLLDASARGELLLPLWKPARFSGVFQDDGVSTTTEANALSQQVGDRRHYCEFRFGGYSESLGRAFCIEREDVVATVFSRIRPTCPEALAVLAGVKVEELPWPLQHWYSDEPYHGNEILDRLDPEDWKLCNPWMKCYQHGGLSFELSLAHSKQALHTRRKKLGLPRKEFIAKKEED